MDRGKYDGVIDEQTWAFIERTNSWYPPETATFTIQRQREIYDAMCREFFAGYPQGVNVSDGTVEGEGVAIPVRRYSSSASPKARIIYYHGGGFVVGGLASHDDVCAELCQRTGFSVTSVDYRLSPEHRHPAAFDDALATFRHEASDGLPALVVGDSAGGNLAAAVSHATRGDALRPVGQVLVYPGLGGDRSKGSYVEHAHAPMLTAADIDFYAGIRTGGVDRNGDPTLAPLDASDSSGLPATVAFPAEIDPLCDDSVEYCRRISATGGKAVCFVQKGWVHGGLRARHMADRVRASFTDIVNACAALGEGHWPY